jgi:hypothetical protein
MCISVTVDSSRSDRNVVRLGGSLANDYTQLHCESISETEENKVSDQVTRWRIDLQCVDESTTHTGKDSSDKHDVHRHSNHCDKRRR